MKISELLDSPEKWIKGANARDIHNIPVLSDDSRAIKWCLIGAILKCYREKEVEICWKIETKIPACFSCVVGFNDNPNTTFEMVKKLVDELDI